MTPSASHPQAEPVRRVLLVLRMEHSFAREIARGLVEFRRTVRKSHWLLYHREPHRDDFDPDDYDGVLACLGDDEPATQRLLAGHTPCIAVSNSPTGDPWPLVTLDDHAVGRTAARHFLDKGYQRLAFVGEPSRFAGERFAGFRDELLKEGIEPEWFSSELPAQWLHGVPKPAALFAANDVQGQSQLNRCMTEGIRVPQEIAVLGVDNDDLLCETSDPPLSSVVTPHRRVGRRAAEFLAQRLRGQEVPPLSRFPPGPIVERASSNALAVDDPLVQRAVALIRDRVDQAMNIAELTRDLGVARRTLESHFQRALGRTPLQVLHTHRLMRAVSLLIETDWTIKRIAEECGYATPPRLNDAFHRHLGRTPSEYREQGQ